MTRFEGTNKTKFNNINLFLVFSIISIISLIWWRDISREGLGGEYNILIIDGLKIGIILFILREICFFSAFFWTFFHSSFNPSQDLGLIWPPMGLIRFNPFNVPLLNTAVLVSSGITVTWVHHGILINLNVFIPFLFTLFLGSYFTVLQGMEYYLVSFSFRDSIFGSVFFIATGFHGFHVLIWTLFLSFCFLRILKQQLTSWNNLGLELAIWYWHFVDVVWLFLFSCIYWWSN